jgi:hypothetical protein
MKTHHWTALTLVVVLLAGCSQETRSAHAKRSVALAKTVAAESSDMAATAVVEAAGTSVAAAATVITHEMSMISTHTAPTPTPCHLSFSADSNVAQFIPITGEALQLAVSVTVPNSPLIALAPDMVRVGAALNLNPYYIAAHAALESAWGTSEVARQRNNLFHFGASDTCPAECAVYYSNPIESLEQVMTHIRQEYLTVGGAYYHNGTTLRSLNRHLKPDQSWSVAVAGYMNVLTAATAFCPIPTGE